VAIGYYHGEQLVLYTQRAELNRLSGAPGFRKPNYWACKALDELSDAREDYGRVLKFLFKREMEPALRRIFAAFDKRICIFEQQECEDRSADCVAGELRNLTPTEEEALRPSYVPIDER